MVGELEHWTSSTARTLPPLLIASLFDLAEIDLLGHRVLLPGRMAQALAGRCLARHWVRSRSFP